MKTTAVRLYGKEDLRLEEFELPALQNGEILVKIISDSVCMSTYKTAMQGAAHLRVPNDVAEKPVIIGHEFCAEIVEVSPRWQDQFAVGEKVIIPPVLSYLDNNQTIGYSFQYIGGVATYCIVSAHIMENGYLMKLESDAFFKGSLIEPASCVLRGYKSTLHCDEDLLPVCGIKEGGNLIILAGCGPMGLEAIDIALHGDKKPGLVVVTDIDKERLSRAAQIFSPEEAAKNGIRLEFSAASDAEALLAITNGKGYDDVFVYAPVPALVELADSILAFDGCLNFFAGPMDKKFSATMNFYQVHYAQHHVAGSSGSTQKDIQDIIRLIGDGAINPAVMITHVGGIDAAIDTTLRLPKIPGGKKLIYTHIRMPMTALADFAALGQKDPRFAVLDRLLQENNGLWNAAAEKYLLDNF